MVEKNSPEEKRAAEQPRTAQVGAQDKGQGGDEAKASDEPVRPRRRCCRSTPGRCRTTRTPPTT